MDAGDSGLDACGSKMVTKTVTTRFRGSDDKRNFRSTQRRGGTDRSGSSDTTHGDAVHRNDDQCRHQRNRTYPQLDRRHEYENDQIFRCCLRHRAAWTLSSGVRSIPFGLRRKHCPFLEGAVASWRQHRQEAVSFGNAPSCMQTQALWPFSSYFRHKTRTKWRSTSSHPGTISVDPETKKIRNVVGRKNSRDVFAHRPRNDRLMQR